DSAEARTGQCATEGDPATLSALQADGENLGSADPLGPRRPRVGPHDRLSAGGHRLAQARRPPLSTARAVLFGDVRLLPGADGRLAVRRRAPPGDAAAPQGRADLPGTIAAG